MEVENSIGGEIIQFRINANKGYVLNKLIVTTDSGETVEFDSGEFIKNKDGTISIDKNKFIMPFENVTIEARWKFEINPNTGNNAIMMMLILISCIGIGIYTYKKKESK